VSEPRRYTCALCKGTFVTEQPFEEVLDETLATFGYVPDVPERDEVCDDCYIKFRAWLDNLPPGRRAELDREAREHQAAQEHRP
jgi:hypothetical protein